MKYLVLGKKVVSFTASDGRTINGTTIYAGCDSDGVEGMVCDKFFIPAEKLPKKDIIVGADVNIFFNRYGKVDSLTIAD